MSDLTDVELEKAILGEMLVDPKFLFAEIEKLRSFSKNAFSSKSHQKIFSAIKEIFEGGKTPDLNLVANLLREKGNIEEIGGASYLAELSGYCGRYPIANMASYAKILVKLQARRFACGLSASLGKLAKNPKEDIEVTMNEVLRSIRHWEKSTMWDEGMSSADFTMKMFEALDEQRKNPFKVGIPSGIPTLDALLGGGFRPGELTILAARPGVGKSALLLKFFLEAGKAGKSAAFFGLEMSHLSLTKRLFSQFSSIDHKKLRDSNLSKEDWNELFAKGEDLIGYKMFLDPEPPRDVDELIFRMRRMKAAKVIEIAFVDYLQLLRPSERTRRFPNRNEEIGYISERLKGAAVDLEISIVVGSQLRRIESIGPSHKFELSDLRDSGCIEQDADRVIFLHRPAAHGIELNHEGEDISQWAELQIAKHRDGDLGKIDLHFSGEKMLFSEQVGGEE